MRLTFTHFTMTNQFFWNYNMRRKLYKIPLCRSFGALSTIAMFCLYILCIKLQSNSTYYRRVKYGQIQLNNTENKIIEKFENYLSPNEISGNENIIVKSINKSLNTGSQKQGVDNNNNNNFIPISEYFEKPQNYITNNPNDDELRRSTLYNIEQVKKSIKRLTEANRKRKSTSSKYLQKHKEFMKTKISQHKMDISITTSSISENGKIIQKLRHRKQETLENELPQHNIIDLSTASAISEKEKIVQNSRHIKLFSHGSSDIDNSKQNIFQQRFNQGSGEQKFVKRSTNSVIEETDIVRLENTTSERPQPKQELLSLIKFDPDRRVWSPWAKDASCERFVVHFTRDAPPLALVSYPGSGNTWTRYLIEAATGTHTGSVYSDYQLQLNGYHGELETWNAGTTLVQKTHEYDVGHIRQFAGRAVLLLRNPYRAVLSYHNFLFGGHKGYAPVANYRRKDWEVFLHLQIKAWLLTALEWLRIGNVLEVLHYEELQQESRPRLRTLMMDLGYLPDDDRLDCLSKHARANFLRHNKFLPDNLQVFTEDIREKFDRAIRYVDHQLRERTLTRMPLHLYEYYNNTDSEQIVRVACPRNESQQDCDFTVDKLNKNSSHKNLVEKLTEKFEGYFLSFTADPLSSLINSSLKKGIKPDPALGHPYYSSIEARPIKDIYSF